MKRFKSLQIGVKSALVILFLFFLVIVQGIFSAKRVKEVNQVSTAIETNWLPGARVLGRINTNTLEYRLAEMEHVLSLKEGEMRSYEIKMQLVLEQLQQNQARYEELVSSREEVTAYQKFKTDWQNYLNESRKSIALSKLNHNQEAAAILRGTSQDLFNQLSKTLDELIQLNANSAASASRQGKELSERFRISVIIFFSLGGVLLLIFLFDIFDNIKKSRE